MTETDTAAERRGAWTWPTYQQTIWTLHATVHILWELFKVLLLVVGLTLLLSAVWGSLAGFVDGLLLGGAL